MPDISITQDKDSEGVNITATLNGNSQLLVADKSIKWANIKEGQYEIHIYTVWGGVPNQKNFTLTFENAKEVNTKKNTISDVAIAPGNDLYFKIEVAYEEQK